jgi:hypothetical protein
LADSACPATAQVFHIFGNRLFVISTGVIAHKLTTEDRWTLDSLDRALPKHLVQPLELDELIDL